MQFIKDHYQWSLFNRDGKGTQHNEILPNCNSQTSRFLGLACNFVHKLLLKLSERTFLAVLLLATLEHDSKCQMRTRPQCTPPFPHYTSLGEGSQSCRSFCAVQASQPSGWGCSPCPWAELLYLLQADCWISLEHPCKPSQPSQHTSAILQLLA